MINVHLPHRLQTKPPCSLILNVALTQSQETQRININLNFHHDVTGASEATNKLKGSVVKYKNQGLNLLESVYELVLEGK